MDEATSTHEPAAAMRDDDAFDGRASEDVVDGEYRSLSGLAVGGLVLALLSPVYFASSALVALPLLAVAVSLVGLWRIDARPDVLTGRWLALAGAALSVAVLSAGVTRGVVTERLLAEQSLPVARAWVERILAGDVDGAFDLTLAPAYRGKPLPPPRAREGGEPVSPEVQRANAVAKYGQTFAPKRLVELGPDTAFVSRGAGSARWLSRGRVAMEHRFSLRPSEGEPLELAVLLERSPPTGGTAGRWTVANSGIEAAR